MGNDARLRIMRLLLSAHPDGMIVGDIQAELGIPSSTLSHHLEKLRTEDLVHVRRHGTFLRYSANAEALRGHPDVPLRGVLHTEQGNTTAIDRGDFRAVHRTPRGRQGEDAMDVKKVVKEKYGEAALRVISGGGHACCGSSPSSCANPDPVTTDLYDEGQKGELPDAAVLASLGCGNPTALAELKPGETVLDLGSGGGIDVLLSARRVSPGGKAYGLDMTDEMLALARANQEKAGATNVEFLKGEIEHIPLPDNSVDVIISNCVINLSADKDRVLREAFRVLKPGGRFAVSDVVTRGFIPADIRRSALLWAGCVAGALDEEEYRTKLASAGFSGIDVEPTRIYGLEEATSFLRDQSIDAETVGPQVEGKFMSAFIRARKPE